MAGNKDNNIQNSWIGAVQAPMPEEPKHKFPQIEEIIGTLKNGEHLAFYMRAVSNGTELDLARATTLEEWNMRLRQIFDKSSYFLGQEQTEAQKPGLKGKADSTYSQNMRDVTGDKEPSLSGKMGAIALLHKIDAEPNEKRILELARGADIHTENLLNDPTLAAAASKPLKP